MATSALTAQNYYSTTLSSPISTTDTTISLNSLPTGSEGYLEIDEGLSTREIIYYTSKGASFVTCPSVAAGRGVGGTSASAHTSGSVVKQKTNVEYWKALQDGSAVKDSDNSTVGLNPSTLYDSTDRIADHVVTGTGVVAISSGLIGTMSNVTFYQGGKRYTITSIPNKTYTASKDTYVDLLAGGTTPTYTEVANGAAAPALAANSIRLAKVVTGASITSITQGVSADSLGNYIYPTVSASQVNVPFMPVQIPIINAKAQVTSGSGFQAISASYFYLHPSFYAVPGKTAYARLFVKASKAAGGDTYQAELFDASALVRITGAFVDSTGASGTTVDTTLNTTNPFMISAEFALPTSVKMGYLRQANQSSVTNTVTAETAFLMIYWR